jgi:hypothetical protein
VPNRLSAGRNQLPLTRAAERVRSVTLPIQTLKNTGAFETNNKPEKSFQARQCESRDELIFAAWTRTCFLSWSVLICDERTSMCIGALVWRAHLRIGRLAVKLRHVFPEQEAKRFEVIFMVSRNQLPVDVTAAHTLECVQLHFQPPWRLPCEPHLNLAYRAAGPSARAEWRAVQDLRLSHTHTLRAVGQPTKKSPGVATSEAPQQANREQACPVRTQP